MGGEGIVLIDEALGDAEGGEKNTEHQKNGDESALHGEGVWAAARRRHDRTGPHNARRSDKRIRLPGL